MMLLKLLRGTTDRSYGRGRPIRLAWRAALAGAAFCLTGPALAASIKIVAFGDSLTAGYLLPEEDGFAPKLQAALRKQGHDVGVVNAGVSGDTTTGGLARLDWTLADGADVVILELGANDMLRGIDPKIPKRNLAMMLEALKAKHVKVLLAGMDTAPSMGKAYADAFNPIYADLARQYDVPLYPFFLNGIMGDRSQHLADELHPNAKGVDTIVAHILPAVDAVLKTVEGKS